ncbi:phage tail protein, partial [Marinimicrobium sp. UBA4509]
MGGSSKQTIGYDYLMGIHMGVCRGPVDALVEIKVADRTAWTGNVTGNQTVQINARELFGGDSAEGGVEGPLEVMMGEPTQPVSTRLASMLDGLVPAFRGRLTLFFDGLVSSLNPYPKPWSLRVRRTTAGWDSDNPWYPLAAKIELAGGDIHAMNPIHIIYQALTDPDWGLGNPRQMVGTSFEAAADQLVAESFGLCLRWNRSSSVEDFTQEMVEHVGGSVYLDHFTGRWEIALIRDDYDPQTLPLFDYDSGLVSIDEDGTSAPAEAVNEVIVTYRDPITNEDRQVRVQNLAGIQSAGAVRSQTLSYTGIPTAELAYRVAQRELRARSTGVKRFKLRMDRRGYQLQPGAVFRISVPSRGIENMILRVGQVRNSELRQGPIEIDAAQDVFGLPATSYVTAQPPGYVPPQITPEPIDTLRVVELNYRDSLGVVRDIAENDTGAWVAALALKANPLGKNFLLQTQPSGATEWTTGTDGDYCPTAELVDEMPIGEVAVAVNLTGAADLDLVEVGTAALIDDEIFRVDAIDAEALTATLARGCIDTVPAAHAAGARVWFYGGGFAGVETVEYEASETVSARLRSRTSTATLPAEDATGDVITLAGRPGRPYPPGRIRINGEAYPAAARGVLRVSWSTRDKVVIEDQLVDASMLNAGAPEVTYNASLVRVDNGQVLTSESNIDGTVVELFAGYSGLVELVINSQALDYDTDTRSYQSVRIPFNYVAAGYGKSWGYAWGGTYDPGVIAPRGGISGRQLYINIMGFENGVYVGRWNDLDVSGEQYLVSSVDGETWTRHSVLPMFWTGTVYWFGGRWVRVFNGFLSEAASLDGPWTELPSPSDSATVTGLSFSEVINGRLFLWGNQLLFSSDDGSTWEQHRLPPVLDENRADVTTVNSIAYGNGYYVAVIREGERIWMSRPDAVNSRMWRSVNLVDWELVTPQLLADGDFGEGLYRGLWSGHVQRMAGRFLVRVGLGQTSEGSERTLFYSTDGQNWS